MENGGLKPISPGLLEDKTVKLSGRQAHYNVSFMRVETLPVMFTAVALGQCWHVVSAQ